MKFASLNLQINNHNTTHKYFYQNHLFSLITHPFSAFSSTTSRFSVPPTARMHDCGGLMIAQNCVTLNMPKLEMVKVPPWNSAGWSLPSRAFAASVLTSCEIDSTPLRSALKTIGVMRPLSVDTATDTSTASNLEIEIKLDLLRNQLFTSTHCLILSPNHAELTSGTFLQAMAAALMTKSFTDNFLPLFSSSLLYFALSARILSTLQFIVK